MEIQGKCHCGNVSYTAKITERKLIKCNCSICTMKGFVHLIVAHNNFELLTNWDDISSYEFNTKTAKHYFCKNCGISAFYQPRSHPDSYSLNFRCLDADINDFSTVDFDGQNWESSINELHQK